MQQAQIVERWLIYGVKWTQKHVCVIHVSRKRKCIRSNVAKPTKGRGKNCKLKLTKSNCELILAEELENFAFFIRPGQRLQICIGWPWHWNLTSGNVCHIEIYNERNIFQFICFSHPTPWRRIIRKKKITWIHFYCSEVKTKVPYISKINLLLFHETNNDDRIFVFLAHSKQQIFAPSRDKLLKTKYYFGVVDLQRPKSLVASAHPVILRSASKKFFSSRALSTWVTIAQSVNSNELKGMGFCIRAAGFNRYNFPSKNSFSLDVWINKPKTERLDLNATSWHFKRNKRCWNLKSCSRREESTSR